MIYSRKPEWTLNVILSIHQKGREWYGSQSHRRRLYEDRENGPVSSKRCQGILPEVSSHRKFLIAPNKMPPCCIMTSGFWLPAGEKEFLSFKNISVLLIQCSPRGLIHRMLWCDWYPMNDVSSCYGSLRSNSVSLCQAFYMHSFNSSNDSIKHLL